MYLVLINRDHYSWMRSILKWAMFILEDTKFNWPIKSVILVFVLLLFSSVLIGHSLENYGLIRWQKVQTENGKGSSANNQMLESILIKAANYLPREAVLWQSLGDIYLRAGKTGAAMSIWSHRDVSPEIFIARGKNSYFSQRFEEAKMWFEIATRIDPKSSSAWLGRSITLQELKLYEEALIALENAEKEALANKESTVLLDIGREYHTWPKPKHNRAIEAYKLAIFFQTFSHPSQIIQAYYHLGEAQIRRAKFYDAIETYKLLLIEDPDHYGAHVNLGRAIMLDDQSLESFILAESIIKDAIEIEPQNKWAYRWLGVFYLDKGWNEKAEVMFLHVLELDPEDIKAKEYFSD